MASNFDLDGPGVTELYVARGRMPTRELHDRKHSEFASAGTSLVIPSASAQSYYVLAWPGLLTSSPQNDNIGTVTVTPPDPLEVASFKRASRGA